MQQYFLRLSPAAARSAGKHFLGPGPAKPARRQRASFCMRPCSALRMSNHQQRRSASCTVKFREDVEEHLARTARGGNSPSPSITNGVHTRNLAVARNSRSFTTATWAFSGKNGRPTTAVWRRVDNIPNAELYRTHERRRERLVVFARNRLRGPARAPRRPRLRKSRAREEVLDPKP